MKFYILTEFPLHTVENADLYPELVLDDLLYAYSKVGSFCVSTEDRINDLKRNNPKLKHTYVVSINIKQENRK